MRSPLRVGLLVVVAAVLATGCGKSSDDANADATTTSRPTTTTAAVTTTVRPTTTTVAPTTTPPATAAPVETTPVTEATTPPAQPAPTPLLVNQLCCIGSAQQVITVSTSGYGTSSATLAAYERSANGWQQVFGPWFAYVGRNGVAPSGEKREGDGRTPSGTYAFDFMFGVNPDPGVHYSYRRITGSNIVWDDDSNSATYNLWRDTSTQSVGASPEPMYNTPSYFYGAVIAYNTARAPGLGSAIFLHVSHGSSTAGCVAVPTDQLLALLRWLDPARSPVIAIGTESALTS